jgi:alkylation response protein AidB-like acyl-CoA dehydrogenase
MDLRFSADDLAFRNEVRAFIDAHLPPAVRAKLAQGRHAAKAEQVAWHRLLNGRGWAVPHWPAEWGGTDWSVTRRFLFQQELELAPAPMPNTSGVSMIAPILVRFGTEEQKRRFLPPTRNADIWWAQGFSEPNAGSDLASLKCAARRDGDHYIVDGTKIWSSSAHHADWMFVLVRTDPASKHRGISFLLVDLKSPGISTRPIPLSGGELPLNQVFFDGVRVPAENLIGEEGQGWDCARHLLVHERISISQTGTLKQRLLYLKTMARDGSARFRDRVAALEVEHKALEVLALRLLASEAGASARSADLFPSLLKLRGAELRQSITELLVEAAGPRAALYGPGNAIGGGDPGDWSAWTASEYFFYRAATIYGGSGEIQRNILAKTALGL